MAKQTLLAVFAHPDDETFRPGGTLSLLARQGVQVELLTFTRGEAGSCGNPPLCSPADLPAVRARELRTACAVLGIQPPRLLDYADGCLHEADPEAMIAHIQTLVDDVSPQVIISFGQDGLSGHPDHIAVSDWAVETFHRNEDVGALYSIAVPQSLVRALKMHQLHPTPDEIISLSVDVMPIWHTKLAAIHCHATQISSSPIMHASQDRQHLFFGREYFVRAAVHHPDTDFLPKILKRHLL